MKVSGLPDRSCAVGITNKISLMARLYLTHLKFLNRNWKWKMDLYRKIGLGFSLWECIAVLFWREWRLEFRYSLFVAVANILWTIQIGCYHFFFVLNFQACKKGHEEVVEVLLKHGVDTKSQSNYDQTAVQIALRNQHFEIQSLLQEHEKRSAVFPLLVSTWRRFLGSISLDSNLHDSLGSFVSSRILFTVWILESPRLSRRFETIKIHKKFPASAIWKIAVLWVIRYIFFKGVLAEFDCFLA